MGTVVHFEFATVALEPQDMPGVGCVAYLISPTGIMFAVLQPEPPAS